MIHEQRRVARHIEGAEAELHARDVSHLPPAVRRVRTFVLRALRAYRLAGRFPRNYVRRERTPVFIDPHGTRCAMAHLLELVGAHELVARVARDANLARIRHLASDPELLRWLAAMGLTVDEASRIQPSYCSITRAECWCGPDGAAEAVVAATDLGVADGGATRSFRVDEVLAGSLVTVGQVIELPNDGVPIQPVILSLRRHSIDGRLVGWAVPLADSRNGRCDIAAKTLAPTRDQLVDALMSTSCSDALIAKDARFAVNSCESDPNAQPESDGGGPGLVAVDRGGCALGGTTGGAPHTLLAIAAAVILARRSMRK